jgi:EAL domain-containing protein (putative c-di-GMP-specific phosphodiesterase class I)
VIAEGIETVEQLAVVKQRECHEAQGYLFSEAVPAQAMGQLLTDSQTTGVLQVPRTSSREAA